MAKYNFVLFVLLLFSFRAFAAPAPTDIEVYGNRILDDDAVIRIAEIKSDPHLSDLEIQRKLETTSLFSFVRVRRNDDGVLQIIVKEKYPFFALPYLYSDSSRTIFGVAGGASDIAGEDSYAVGRYQTGSGEHIGSLAYRDDFFHDSLLILGYEFEYENALHYIYEGRDIASQFGNNYLGNNFQVGYHLSSKVTLELDTHFEEHNFEITPGVYSHGTQVSNRLLVDYGNFYLNEGLAHGRSMRAYVEIANPLGSYRFHQYGFTAADSLYVHNDFNWILRTKSEYADTPPRYQLFELGGANLRGYPSEIFRSNAYTKWQNDFLLTQFNAWTLKFRPLLFGDWAYVSNGGRTDLGAGLQVFFPKVVVPAIQIYAGYGFNPNGFSLVAAIGPQF